MELTLGSVLGTLPVVFLGGAVALSIAYNRLHGRYQRVENDRDGYLQVLESSNDALFVIDFVNGRIHQVNARAEELLGRSRAQLVGSTIFELHPKEYLDRSAVRIADAWENGGGVYDDIPLIGPEGELIEVESSVRVTTYCGDPAIILLARDIRDRLALQRALDVQRAQLEEQNAELVSSIRYAQRIQRAVLPEAEHLQDLLPGSFILFRPRDIVSGDLYWFAERNGKVLITAADCTGHGVPGALLSLIGASLFQEVVLDKGIDDPGMVLDAVREGMIQSLNKANSETLYRDGMNAALVALDPLTRILLYAGGFAPLYIIRSGELIEHKGDRMPIGPQEGEQRPFSTVRMQLEEGDRIFLFSDGIPDQFGGPHGKKLKSSGLKDWLLETCDRSIEDQYQAISDRFRLWMADEEQVDDVLLIGVQIG
ncbi:MAG: SpoIIE family protein phosphatase [Flavobacteriales bacterium]